MASLIKTDKISKIAGGSQEFVLPGADGTANQHLKTDGSGNLGWASPPTGIALTGSTNTWIPTITGANALTGTANFTYDGNTLDIKNGGTASSINLYCETSNLHYTKIKSGPHSGATSYTLTLPNAPPSSNGQSLTATTAGAASWSSVGGLTGASIWRLSSPFSISAGAETTISTNLEEDDSVSAGRIGNAMTESSGIFTFPTTGYWLIQAVMDGYYNGATRYMHIRTYTTINNSSYSMRAYASQGIANQGSEVNATGAADFIFDVTDTAQCKCQFKVFSPQAVTMSGETDKNRTHFLFLKLGDT